MTYIASATRSRQMVDAIALNQRPPVLRERATRTSGRPFCRIFFATWNWILEIDPASGGLLEPPRGSNGKAGRRLSFKALVEAVAYAERHGLDYRVEQPRIPSVLN